MGGVLRTDGAWAALDGVVIANNTWGRGDLVNGRDYVQTATYGAALADGIRFDWAWPDAAAGVRAYPELFAGRKPWGPQTGGDLLPLPVADTEGLSLEVSLDWGGEAGGYNVALDLWIAEAPDAGPEAILQEVMVWLKPGDFAPAGTPAARLTAGDVSGPLYVRHDHGGGWTYLALVSDRPVLEGEIDLGALLAALEAQGRIAADSWLLTVELGAEVVRGEGWLQVDRFDLRHPAAAQEAALGVPPRLDPAAAPPPADPAL
jgi:hypothetical protein